MKSDDMSLIIRQFFSKQKGEFCIVPVAAIPYESDYRILDLFRWQSQLFFSSKGIEVRSVYDYNMRNIIFYKVGMKMPLPYNWTIQIPYGSRSKYLSAVKKLSQAVPLSGCITLFVNNNPYYLEAYLVVESPSNQEKIEQIIRESSLKTVYNRGIPEFLSEMADRNWNSTLLPHDGTMTDIVFEAQFFFVEKEDCHPENKVERPRLFISYSHADKSAVLDIITYMKTHGFNCWWDEQEIDFGDSIVKRVHDGIRDCSLAIIFISKSSAPALFAKHELRTFLQEKIYYKKDWLIVRLDDVNPNDVIEGLLGYNYYDYFVYPDVGRLAEAILKELSNNSVQY